MTGSAPAPRPGGGSAARLGRPGGRRTHRVGRRLPAPCPHAGATAASGGAGPARRTDDGGGALAGASVAPDAARGRWEPGGRIAAGGGGSLRRACVGGARPGTHRRCGRRTGRPRRPGVFGVRRLAQELGVDPMSIHHHVKGKRRCSTRCPRRCSPRWRPSRTATAPPIGRKWPAGRRTSTGPCPTGTRGSSRCW